MAYGTSIIGSLRRRSLDRRGWHRRLLEERPARRVPARRRRHAAARLVLA